MVVSAEVLKKRKKIARDLQKMENFLWNEFPNSDFSSIQSAITELNNSKYIPQVNNVESCRDRWGYDAADLLFRFASSPDKSKPHPIQNVELVLSISVRGNVNDLNTFKDPLEQLKFDIVIRGKHDGKDLIATYHLDRHIEEIGDNPSLEPHPKYHFQFGGKKMMEEYNVNLDTGNIMFLNPPRIPHHPMELILGVDFIISNFFPQRWKNLTENVDEYNNLIEKYQGLFVKYYTLNLASYWNKGALEGNVTDLTPNKIYPQLK